MILRGTTNIRDVIAFPKTQAMCGLPSPVDEKYFKAMSVKVIPPPTKT